MGAVPRLVTVGVIGERLGVQVARVAYILRTRPHIRPAARAGTVRLYREIAVAQVRDALGEIEARREQKEADDAQ